MSKYNPRYEAYARANGRTVEDQLVQDRKDWPGGSMIGFSQWNNAQIDAFAKEHPEAMMFFPRLGRDDTGRPPVLIGHDSYDKWLLVHYPRREAQAAL